MALDLAHDVAGRADLAKQARRLYAEASNAGSGEMDSSGVLALLEPKNPRL